MEFCLYLHICHLVPNTDLEILHTYPVVLDYFRTGPYFYLDFIQARIYGHLVSKESPGSAGDPGLIPRLGRFPEEGNGNPLEYPCIESHGQRSLVGCSPWGCKESGTTE